MRVTNRTYRLLGLMLCSLAMLWAKPARAQSFMSKISVTPVRFSGSGSAGATIATGSSPKVATTSSSIGSAEKGAVQTVKGTAQFGAQGSKTAAAGTGRSRQLGAPAARQTVVSSKGGKPALSDNVCMVKRLVAKDDGTQALEPAIAQAPPKPQREQRVQDVFDMRRLTSPSASLGLTQ